MALFIYRSNSNSHRKAVFAEVLINYQGFTGVLFTYGTGKVNIYNTLHVNILDKVLLIEVFIPCVGLDRRPCDHKNITN